MTAAAATDTIAAVATGPAAGAVGLVRLSGPAAFAIAARVCTGAGAVSKPLPPPRQAVLRRFHDVGGAALDSGLLLTFAAPHSFTGEDVAELQGHGGVAVLAEVLAACVAHGARVARPGEFSERAFLNDRLDLAQAEAIADLIGAQSGAAVRAAARTLEGAFSRAVTAAVEQLVEARVWVEGALDFADEDVDWLADARLHERLAAVDAALAATQASAAQGARLREGLSVAILGAPNVGKSTLLNALAGHDAAIVSPQAGTTRDVLREHLVLPGGLPVTIVDTAGLRATDDAVEAEGIARARAAAAKAELLLYVVDARVGFTAVDAAELATIPERPTLLVCNKSDLVASDVERVMGIEPGSETGAIARPAAIRGVVALAAKTGAGLPALFAALAAEAGIADLAEGVFIARARHLAALSTAREHLAAARSRLVEAAAPELAAEELRLAQEALGAITGQFGSEELLGAIFNRFCIGK